MHEETEPLFKNHVSYILPIYVDDEYQFKSLIDVLCIAPKLAGNNVGFFTCVQETCLLLEIWRRLRRTRLFTHLVLVYLKTGFRIPNCYKISPNFSYILAISAMLNLRWYYFDACATLYYALQIDVIIIRSSHPCGSASSALEFFSSWIPVSRASAESCTGVAKSDERDSNPLMVISLPSDLLLLLPGRGVIRDIHSSYL